MEWPRVFHLLAHELRSPAAVLSGYAHMLSEGHLTDDERMKAYAQIDRAAVRIAAIGHQAAEIGRWLSDDARAPGPGLDVDTVVSRAIAQTARPDRVTIRLVDNAGTLVVRMLTPDALCSALATVIDAVGREVLEEDLRVLVQAAKPPYICDIVVGPASVLATAAPSGPEATEALRLERSGLGLALVAAAAIVAAHHGAMWTAVGHRETIGVSLAAVS